MPLGYVNLPIDTICPLTKDLPDGPKLLRENSETVRMSVRMKDSEITCRQCTKRRHYPSDFVNCPFYSDMMNQISEIKKIHKKTDEETEEEEEDDDSEEFLTIFNGKEDNPIVYTETQDVKELKKELYTFSFTLNEICNSISNKFQEIVEASPLKKSGQKYKPSHSMKDLVWRSNYRDTNTALCPVCIINRIECNNYVLGHIHPEVRCGTNTPDNFMPICQTCNLTMGTQHLYTYAWRTYKRILWQHPRL